MKTAVILNIRQAKIFSAQQKVAGEVVSFCPTATYHLQQKGYLVTSTASIYGAFSHARVVALVARELALITESAAKQYGLETAEAEGLRVYLYHYLSCVYHLHFALRRYKKNGQQCYWVDQGRGMEGEYEVMFAALAAQPSPVILAYSATDYSTAHYLLAEMFNRITLFLIRRSGRLKVMDYGDELPRRIIAAMVGNGETPLVMHTHAVCKHAYKTARFFVKSLVRMATRSEHPVYLFRAAPPAHYRRHVEAFSAPRLYAPEVARMVQLMVERFIPFVRTEVAMGKRLILGARPHVAVSDHAKYAYILGGLEVLAWYGGKHAMLNHGTHTVQYDPISQLAAKNWASQQRAINRNTTHSLPKSPLTAALVKDIRDDARYQMCKINVYGKIDNKAARDGKLVVLQAGNYTDAFNHIAWCKETADEYLLAIIELLEEVAKLEDVELIIKLKNKKADTHKTIVEGHIARLGIADKARVDTTSKFSDLMARAHVVVCNLSGTIEEALANHIPVMVHTYRKSYFHIAERSAMSAAKGPLAPAYLVKERADIARILTLLSRERAHIHDADLFKDVAWQEGERMNMQTLAGLLVQEARA